MTSVPKPSRSMAKKKKRKKLLPLGSLVKKADRIFSSFIRERDAVELNGKCCTCGKPGNQAGHFIKRSHKKIRWNPQNVHLQCFYCNHALGGNESEYARFIIEKYGMETFGWLLDQKGTYKPSREELNKIILAYNKS